MSSAERRRSRGAFVTLACWLAAPALVAGEAYAANPADIAVYPQDGQTADEMRRDRFECHNWAVAQTGTAPIQPSGDEQRERRGERIGKVLAGAAVGAAAGSVIRGARDHRDAGDGALAGGVLGAIAGAVIGDREKSEDDGSFDEYFRALDACMSGRGYSLSVED